ncbi:MAG: hypothetical protein WCI18_04060 [Pseudomonadota bacterium]
MKRMSNILILFVALSLSQLAKAGIIFEPYLSIASTKSIKPNRAKGTESETISERKEGGLKAGIKLGSFFSLYGAVGQSKQTTTTTQSQIVDQFGQIDFEKDLDTRTSGKETKLLETQNKAKVGLDINPSFWIFIVRTTVGVAATQRLVKAYEEDVLLKSLNPDPIYKPFAGAGLGVRLGPKMFALAQYNFNFYMFPKKEPFEREVNISYGISL